MAPRGTLFTGSVHNAGIVFQKLPQRNCDPWLTRARGTRPLDDGEESRRTELNLRATETQEQEQLYVPLKICSAISMAKQKATTHRRNPVEYIVGNIRSTLAHHTGVFQRMCLTNAAVVYLRGGPIKKANTQYFSNCKELGHANNACPVPHRPQVLRVHRGNLLPSHTGQPSNIQTCLSPFVPSEFGRPSVIQTPRIHGSGLLAKRWPIHCRRCGQIGYNRCTCSQNRY